MISQKQKDTGKQGLPEQPKLAKPVKEKINVENVVRKDDSFEKLAERCLKSTPKGKPVHRTNEVDDKLLDHIKTKSYLYQDKSQKKGDGLKTTPWSDMVNKE